MTPSAFSEIRRYLDYFPIAKWCALASAAGTAVLFVCFLFLLGLAADQLVNQGAIPTFRELPPADKAVYLNQFQEIAEENTSKDQWEERLELLGFEKGYVNPDEFKSLISLTQVKDETALSQRDMELRRELLWRWHVFEYLKTHVGEIAAEHFGDRTHALVKTVGPDLALDREIPDCGILSLVVRAQQKFYGRFAGWLAYALPWMWAFGALAYLVGLFFVAVFLAVVRGLLMFANKYTAAIATTGAATRLRRALYHQTYRLGTLAFRALGPTEAVGVSTRHLQAVHDGLYSWLTVYFREPVKFFLLFLFALMVHIWLALAFLLFSLLVWILGGQIAAYYRKESRLAEQRAVEQLGLIQESLMLMRLVKVYLMENFNQSRVERQLARYSKLQRRAFFGEAVYKPLMTFLGILAALGLLLISGIAVQNGQLGITGVILLVTALVSLYLPLQVWLENRRLIRRARDSSVVVLEFLKRQGSVGQAVEAEFLAPLAQSLEFDKVSLKEPGTGRRLLKDVSLNIRAGQRVALVGPEDIEKYAFVYLIPRFLDPSAGEIRIDRKNLRWVTLDSLRAQIAIVLQHNLVFNDTVANNIGCGDKSYTLPQIIDVAKLAHAHQFIQKLPKGYETIIGEQGHALSISEQYRIALARAILRDPALIIIEEPSVALDEETKDLLDDTMKRVLPGRTVIFLPHRLSTIRNCDKVFLLYKGEIIASGDHKELLSDNELYRHLQYLEFNEFAGAIGSSVS